MILDPKFLIGVALGGVLGVVLAPQAAMVGIDLPGLKHSILARTVNGTDVTDKGDWPTDQAAKVQLFMLSKWDIENYGPQSSVHVDRCIRLARNAIACEMTAKLGWIKEDTHLEWVFERKDEDLALVSLRTK
ncbi:hypothetical protein G6L41_026335 (plasmid) [Agrobacterium tumefaciens]|uniref:hypothetical protein n=1 Tax=Agrobacterium tumefaciens TaxID=358 RepID=UPI0015721777|nr:hypothetical protein [Agrobacterium tumefaciens]WCK17224.1 hypothetical protein G6L41_026335 [Agrobacterium tumefaciens]